MANGSASRDGAPGDTPWSAATIALWTVMMLLATGVSGYGFWLLAIPEARPWFLVNSTVPLAVLIHFAGGALALLLGPWQFITGLTGRRSSVHVWSGRVYVAAVLIGAGAGLVLAPFSMGGLTAHLGFGAMALLTLGTTGRALQLVRRGDVTEHRRWMIRSFALILAAVTLRLQIPASLVAGIAFESAYPVIAWACWVPNLLVAEWMLRRRETS